jgi:hypothetical protein
VCYIIKASIKHENMISKLIKKSYSKSIPNQCMCVAELSAHTVAVVRPSGGEDRLAMGQSHKTRLVQTNKITQNHVYLSVGVWTVGP